MRVLLCFALAILVLPGCRKGACDSSTDEAARKSYTRVTGEELSKNDCVQRSPRFQGYVKGGAFANDRGCMWKTAMYKCEVATDATQVRIFADNGWNAGDANVRHRLALDWLTEEEMGALESPPEDFTDNGARPAGAPPPPARTFTPPEFTAAPDGGFVVKYWRAIAGGMLPETTYELVTVPFAGNGKMGESKTVDRFTHRSGVTPPSLPAPTAACDFWGGRGFSLHLQNQSGRADFFRRFDYDDKTRVLAIDDSEVYTDKGTELKTPRVTKTSKTLTQAEADALAADLNAWCPTDAERKRECAPGGCSQLDVKTADGKTAKAGVASAEPGVVTKTHARLSAFFPAVRQPR